MLKIDSYLMVESDWHGFILAVPIFVVFSQIPLLQIKFYGSKVHLKIKHMYLIKQITYFLKMITG